MTETLRFIGTFLAAFVTIFVVAFLLHFALMSPFVIWGGYPWQQEAFSAGGCGAGTALVSSLIIAVGCR